MTLAKVIIYGKVDDLNQYLVKERPSVNEIDEYGYTPLIETTIVNDTDKAKLIIDSGADLEFTDLTGRTALHWASDAGNLSLCQLLLEKGANPNAYTRASQSVLVLPLLRKQDDIKKLLYQHGADLAFAQDFINAKLLGHAFSLEGRVDIVDPKQTFTELEFEGFYLHFTLSFVHQSLTDFKNSFTAKHWSHLGKKLDLILGMLRAGSELMAFQHHLVNLQQQSLKISQLLAIKPCLIPVGQAGHAISLIRLGQWLVRCDRGSYGKTHGTVIIYRIGHSERWTVEWVKQLMYTRMSSHDVNEGLEKKFSLQSIMTLPLSCQLSGNCSWANIEAVIPATLFLLLLRDGQSIHPGQMTLCKQIALSFFEEWIEWDKNRALSFCIQSMQHAGIARSVSKAAILGAILFQRLSYHKEKDILIAERILRQLTKPPYRFILKSYLQAFEEERHDNRYKNLIDLLDHMGFDADNFMIEG